MSSKLQLDVRNLSLGRRHQVNAYEVKAGIDVIDVTVWSMSERVGCEVVQKERYINTFPFTFRAIFVALLTDVDNCPLLPRCILAVEKSIGRENTKIV